MVRCYLDNEELDIVENGVAAGVVEALSTGPRSYTS